MKYRNKYKTFQYHIGRHLVKFERAFRLLNWGGYIQFTFFKHCKEFKIDNHYNITSGKYKGKHYKDVLKKCSTMCMLYVEDNPDGTLKHIDFEIIK